MKKIIKINNFFIVTIISFILIFTSFINISIAASTISNCEEAVNFVVEQLSIDKDDVLIYVWGPVNKGQEVFSTNEYIMDVPEKGYIIYIDLYPKANLFHPVKYIFLSETTDELIVKDSISPPKNFAEYHMIETAIGQLLYSIQNRRAHIPEVKIPTSNKISSDSRWAVLMNGGYNSYNNHVRYWNDLSNIYITLVEIYGYLDENIIVLCSDGLDPSADQSNGQNSDPDLDGDGDDDIMYSCILSNVEMVFEDLADILNEGSELFIFQTDHGSSNGGWDTLFNLWNTEELTDAHFASLLDGLPDCEIVCTFEPCFSGGFLDDVVVPPGPIVASSACRHDEYSWAMNNLEYDEYVFHWTAAVKGEDAYGNAVDADYNQDDIITMDEAFIYAEANDAQSEDPQYGDYPEGIGEIISLWPGSEPPETPTKPDGPEEWIQNLDAIFYSNTTDPEEESIYYKFDWGDGNCSGWVGPYASGQTGKASYAWTELGEYEIRAIAKDINDIESNWSEPHIISIVENEPPEKPTISGPKTGTVRKALKFTFVSTDPDGHDLYYMVNWGDDHHIPYQGPYASGEEVTFSHAWGEEGEYTIIAKARDAFGEKSPQNSFKLTITKNKSVINPVLFQLLKHLTGHFPLLERLFNLL